MKRILVAPLDWGLGHATRCIPIIREFQRQGCEVLIAGSGDSLSLLRREFPALQSFALPGYSPEYPRRGSMTLKMMQQLPKFFRVISGEHTAVERLIETHQIDFIIADNRYGCWSNTVPSVFITHQSNVMMPERFGFLRHPVRRLNEQYMNRFHACWIPDFPGEQSLAGNLISFGSAGLKTSIQYIGSLSRFERKVCDTETLDVLAIFSGPEPQRTIFEDIVTPQLKESSLRHRIVRGLPATMINGHDQQTVDFLSSEPLQAWIEASRLVIARSGYSTIMDLRALGKKAILVPTPGQTEQEYLAARLMKAGIAFSMRQADFNLATGIRESENFSGFAPGLKNTLLPEAISKLLGNSEIHTLIK